MLFQWTYNVNQARQSRTGGGPCSKLSLLIILFSMVSLGPLNLRIPKVRARHPCSSAPGTGGHSLAELVPGFPAGLTSSLLWLPRVSINSGFCRKVEPVRASQLPPSGLRLGPEALPPRLLA